MYEILVLPKLLFLFNSFSCDFQIANKSKMFLLYIQSKTGNALVLQ